MCGWRPPKAARAPRAGTCSASLRLSVQHGVLLLWRAEHKPAAASQATRAPRLLLRRKVERWALLRVEHDCGRLRPRRHGVHGDPPRVPAERPASALLRLLRAAGRRRLGRHRDLEVAGAGP